MLDLIQLAGSLGVGAVLGLIIFFMYRADRHRAESQLREDRKFMEDRLTKLLEQDQETRNANTKALTELITLITRMNGESRRPKDG